MVSIFPAILATKELDYRNNLAVASALPTEWIHIDIVDGKFADNQTVSLETIKKYKTSSSLEAHLMVVDPSSYVPDLISFGFRKIILPAETEEPLSELVKKVKEAKVLVGVSLNPETRLEVIKDLLDQIDFVLLLGVNPGLTGQEMIPQSVEKLNNLVGILPAGVRTEFDGGINPDNVKLVADSGVDILVVGHIVTSPNPKEEFNKLLRRLD